MNEVQGAALALPTRAGILARQARDAFDRGQAALAGGDVADALRWLDRARRFAPEDDTVGFTLGIARLAQGDAAAALALLDGVARRTDAREAWLASAVAAWRTGCTERAAAALRTLLSRHSLANDPTLAPLAEAVAAAEGAPGWCGLREDGCLAMASAAPVTALLDGREVSAARPVPAGRRLEVTAGARPLLGSPLDLVALRRTEGFVAALAGGLEGWAWHPASPDMPPRLTIRAASGRFRLDILAEDAAMTAARSLARPRRFVVPAASLPGAGLLHVCGPDGRDLAGSPLDPSLESRNAVSAARAVAAAFPVGPVRAKAPPVPPLLAVPADAWARPAAAPCAPRRRVAVVVPVYGNTGLTLACLDAVLATAPTGTRVVVVDDATPEPELAQALDALARRRRIRLLRHARNRGFPAAANAGLRAARALPGDPDVVLLNSDTLTPPGWIEALRAAVQAEPDIGTATPLSNDATILSYPLVAGGNPAPDAAGLRRLAALAARVNAGITVEIPTAVGFCMYIRRECLDATGLFREDLFAQGYGEENDFCLRARHLGWRHVAVPGTFVAHLGGASFGAARSPLIVRNNAILERLHPGYRALVAAHQRADPLLPARRRLDAAGFAASRHGAAAILITHDSGGGVERAVRARCAALREEGLRPLVLRPVRTEGMRTEGMRTGDGADPDRASLCVVSDGPEPTTPNLRFALPAEWPALLRLLRAARPAVVELHHLLGHDPSLAGLAERLGVPCDVHVHDYAWLCPRITLVGPTGHYCGEPEADPTCEACIADAGTATGEAIAVAALRRRSAARLGTARRVIVPSADAAARLRRHFPAVLPLIRPLDDDAALPPRRPGPATPVRRVCVVGGIGPEKGYDVLLACARDAAGRRLPLEFVLVGHSPDDARLLATGRVFVTGPYEPDEVVAQIRAQDAHLGFLPSVWPETWCYTLGEAWRAGLDVAVFDIGAQSERVRRTGRGWVLPFGLLPAAVNNALLAVAIHSGHECLRASVA
ncbi:Glycosyltransferase [Rhodovastum atsumiense]|uniref:Glycosyltransferase n=1 Tax=Rhodovastum atsumiense TaxID=504468 RepID=A0A5M6IJF2_9PROT|nr:glycosyltransferase [Rhodovastum atsumiense]KAA5608403.1 glycosyltransferase [Rhodovastum atsumiense]CAH2599409.1 Glycosyltransferase [Rhodovastum atsumiense]